MIQDDSALGAVPVIIYSLRTNAFSVVFPRLKYWSLLSTAMNSFDAFKQLQSLVVLFCCTVCA